jgi:hypothetical protein
MSDRFARGDRVRQKFGANAIIKERLGTIMGRAKFGNSPENPRWLIQWDNDPSPKPRLVPIYERDLEPEIYSGFTGPTPPVQSAAPRAPRTPDKTKPESVHSSPWADWDSLSTTKPTGK